MAGFGSPRVVRDRLTSADALLVLGSRLNEPTSCEYQVPAMGQRWMHIDLEPRTGPVGFASAPELAIAADARAFLRAANARLKEAVLLAEPLRRATQQRRGPRGLGGGLGGRCHRLERARASIRVGSSRTCGGCSPTTRS